MYQRSNTRLMWGTVRSFKRKSPSPHRQTAPPNLARSLYQRGVLYQKGGGAEGSVQGNFNKHPRHCLWGPPAPDNIIKQPHCLSTLPRKRVQKRTPMGPKMDAKQFWKISVTETFNFCGVQRLPEEGLSTSWPECASSSEPPILSSPRWL